MSRTAGAKIKPIPVPTSGGVAFAPAFLAAWLVPMVFLAWRSGFPMSEFWSTLADHWLVVMAFSAGVLALGWLDDLGLTGTRLKFALLAAGSLAAAWFGLAVGLVHIPGFDPAPLNFYVGVIGSALWLFVLVNATNFMDGADGFAMSALAMMCFGLLAIAASSSPSVFELPLGALIGALIGFLVLNAPGRLYAGDSGAYFAGAVFAGVSLWLVGEGSMTVWTPATVALPFLVDVFLTLAWRLKNGRNLLSPHRDHAYQLMIQSGRTHNQTAALWVGLSAAASGIALLAHAAGPDATYYVFWLTTAAGVALWVRQRLETRVPADA